MEYGWLNIDKPYGMSSGRAVSIIKRILKCKVGHAGTLDPLATGVLPIAFGEATKTTSYVMDAEKAYSVRIKWGEQRDTDDAEGKIVAVSDARPSEKSIREAIKQYVGHIEQVPPAFSAIRIGGERAYSIARAGKFVELGSRVVCIDDIKLTDIDDSENSASFLVKCKKGVYIRSLARDLGIALGCLGYVASLHRKKVGVFTDDSAVALEDLERVVSEKGLAKVALPLSVVMSGIPCIEVHGKDVEMLKNGRDIRLSNDILNGLCVAENCGMCYLSQAGGVPVAVCEVVDGTARPVRVFNV